MTSVEGTIERDWQAEITKESLLLYLPASQTSEFGVAEAQTTFKIGKTLTVEAF